MELEAYKELQTIVSEDEKCFGVIPNCFCVRNNFPSAHSGKRDIKFIKSDVDGMVELEKSKVKTIIKK